MLPRPMLILRPSRPAGGDVGPHALVRCLVERGGGGAKLHGRRRDREVLSCSVSKSAGRGEFTDGIVTPSKRR